MHAVVRGDGLCVGEDLARVELRDRSLGPVQRGLDSGDIHHLSSGQINGVLGGVIDNGSIERRLNLGAVLRTTPPGQVL